MPASIRASYSANLRRGTGCACTPMNPPTSLPQRADERLALPQAVDRLEPVDLLEVVAGVQVREDRARLVPRGARDLDDVLDLLARLLGDADVFAGRAELAGAEGSGAQYRQALET